MKEFIEPVDTLMHLFYFYKKSSKKHQELKDFCHLLEGQFEMYNAGVWTLKTTGTRWIDCRIAAMRCVIEKFGLCKQHLQCSIDTARKSQDHTTLQGKFTLLINAKFLLRCALFTDVLGEAKHFSLITQEENIDIIHILDSVENTKHIFERLLKKLQKNQAYVFQLPTIKLVTEEIESNDEDDELMCQNQKVRFYSRDKRFIEDHIEFCLVNLEETSINIPSNDADHIIFDLCCILNCNSNPLFSSASCIDNGF